jgi:hypothetical protein
VEPSPDPERTALRLAEKMIQLLDEGSFTATYKYAVLIGLMDLCLERATATGMPPDAITTRQLAEKVIELYWPHSIPYNKKRGVLKQNPGHGQMEIITRIQDFRERTGMLPLPKARAGIHSPAFTRLTNVVEWKLVEMPLPKLQRLGNEENRFLYTYTFPGDLKNTKLLQPYWEDGSGDFNNQLELCPGVGAALIALNGVLRPLIHRQWAMMVAKLNGLPESKLEAFLFESQRTALAAMRPFLHELQEGRCFYCGKRLTRSCHVDHFMPWSRHPDNGIHNLVAADEQCNLRKSHYLAAAEHVERWSERAAIHDVAITDMARKRCWEADKDRTFNVARITYRMIPEGTRLWLGKTDFVPIDPTRIAAALAA